jgi:hypothetical protein
VSSFYAPTTSIKGKEKDTSIGPDVDQDEEAPRRRTLKGQSAAMARKYLKKDVERKLADGSERFLNAFGEVDHVSLAVGRLIARRKDSDS